MPLSPENSERLKLVAKAAIVPLMGVAALKLSRQENRTRYVYYLDASKSFMVGLLEDGKDKIIEFSGDVLNSQGDVKLDDADFGDEEVSQFESAFFHSEKIEE